MLGERYKPRENRMLLTWSSPPGIAHSAAQRSGGFCDFVHHAPIGRARVGLVALALVRCKWAVFDVPRALESLLVGGKNNGASTRAITRGGKSDGRVFESLLMVTKNKRSSTRVIAHGGNRNESSTREIARGK